MKETILQVKNLHVHYVTDDEEVRAVNGISFDLAKGESLGFVGETGAGKTTTALAIMQLIPDPPGLITEGEILFKGQNLIFNSDKENQKIRGNGISMIFQDPMTALNPIMTVGEQLTEVVMRHQKLGKAEAQKRVKEMLEVVGVKADRFNDYPHQFSGGMKQRVVITMALICNPDLLIADEPTTALDVTIQAQVLDIMMQLREKYKMAMILITHDLGVVAETCDRVAIVYAGEIVEIGTVEEVYLHPKHPYTKGLFDSIPKIDEDTEKLVPIDGMMPNMAELPEGCYFHPRCRYCKDVCKKQAPKLSGEGHKCKCHFPLKEERG
ncbi:MAG: ABC transporter ATP-binding protein [bacterium]|nr:ABC transporter ATP-binding protein [bacterium]